MSPLKKRGTNEFLQGLTNSFTPSGGQRSRGGDVSVGCARSSSGRDTPAPAALSPLDRWDSQGGGKPMKFGINLSFAVKRWPEPPAWAKLVRETLGLNLVQFTYDLLDPWSPEPMRRNMAAQVRQAAQDFGITIESAFSGLANY